MPYTTPDQVRLALAGDANASGQDTAAHLSEDALQLAVKRATARIDARLRSRYRIPFDPVPQLIADIAVGLAGFYATLTARRGAPIDPDDPVRLGYADAVTALAELADGWSEVDDGSTPPPDSSTQVGGINPWDGDLFVPDDFHLGHETGRRPPSYRP